MVTNVQMNLDNVDSRCQRNRLKLSESKSKVVLFGSNEKLKKVDYTNTVHIGDTHLDFVDKYKRLGVNLDKYMNLTSLLSDVKNNVSGHLFKLRKIRQTTTTFCAILIYKQTILPLLDYAGFLLFSLNASDRYDLQILQNDALRTCYNVRLRDCMSIKKLHAEANLLSLDQRQIIQLLLCIIIKSAIMLGVQLLESPGTLIGLPFIQSPIIMLSIKTARSIKALSYGTLYLILQ